MEGMPHMRIHESAEDYLERILMLAEAKGAVRSVDIAAELGVTKPSVSRPNKLKDVSLRVSPTLFIKPLYNIIINLKPVCLVQKLMAAAVPELETHIGEAVRIKPPEKLHNALAV